MKSKILFSIVFLLVIIGLYSPASYSAQSYNIWLANGALSADSTSWSFDVYIQNTGDALVVYSFQIGFTYDPTALYAAGTKTAVWSNEDPGLAASGETRSEEHTS